MDEKMNDMWGEQTGSLSQTSEKAAYFTESKFAMFVHWGLYSQAGGKWQGKFFHGISEWLMAIKRISASDYASLAKEFNPADFNAADFVSVAKPAGMKYIIVTAKHHEGFAMFRSQDPFNACDGTPFKRDPLAELVEECRKQGLGLGFYYSQFQDWQAYNRWDKSLENSDFDHYFRTKCLPQIRELMTNYGKLTLLWFDTPGKMTYEQSQEIVDMIRELQPQALVNSRIGNGVGDYVSMNDNEVPAMKTPGLWECIRTSNGSWGYAEADTNFCSAREILQDLIRVVARGGTYMVNVGPDRQGRIPEPCRYALMEAGKWMQKYADKVIYSAKASCWDYVRPWGDCTRKGCSAFFILDDFVPGKTIVEYHFPGTVEKVLLLGKNREIPFTQQGEKLRITLPLEIGTDMFEVLEVLCSSEIPDSSNSVPALNADYPCRLGAEHAQVVNAEHKHHFWAERFGEFTYINIICNWQKNARASWQIAVDTPGYYRVKISYQNVDLDNRVWQIISSSGEKIIRWLPDARALPPSPSQTEPVARFHTANAGVLKFDQPGEYTLTFCSPEPEKSSNLQVSELILEKF